MGRLGLGVTAGKFYPPHLGHAHLLREAAARCDRLLVLVCDHPDQTLDVDRRITWLTDATPGNVIFAATPDDLPADDSVAWAERALAIAGELDLGLIDVAFTSESYGATWAAALGASHVEIDAARTEVPISGSRIRANFSDSFDWLVPAARADLTRRVVLVGAESTGKTTLARDAAAMYGTVWVPEWARTYDAGKRTSPSYRWEPDEFIVIAREQARLEDQLARMARNGLLFVDTDALATAAWHRRYVGYDDPELDRAAADRKPDMYLLCAPDLEWFDDGTRESRVHRGAMHADLAQRLDASGVPYATVTGHGDARLARATAALEALRPLPTLA